MSFREDKTVPNCSKATLSKEAAFSDSFEMFCSFDDELSSAARQIADYARRLVHADGVRVKWGEREVVVGSPPGRSGRPVTLSLSTGAQLELGIPAGGRDHSLARRDLAALRSEACVLLAWAKRAWTWRLQAMCDPLTGLANRRFLSGALRELFRRARSERIAMTLILIDVDNLHQVNKEHGHEAGDEALRTVAHILRSCVRPYDIVGRLGGDEFILVLWNAEPRRQPRSRPIQSPERIVQRIQSAIRRKNLSAPPPPGLRSSRRRAIPASRFAPFAVTVSMGIAVFPRDAKTPTGLLRQADAALDQAKRRGRNRIELWPLI